MNWLKVLFVGIFSFALIACDGGSEGRFLGEHDGTTPLSPYTNGDIQSVALFVAGQDKESTLPLNQQVKVDVAVTYSDGQVVFAHPQDVEYTYHTQAFAIEEDTLSTFSDTGSESVNVVAEYHGHSTQAVKVNVIPKILTSIQITPTEQRLITGARTLFRLDAFYQDGSTETDVNISNYEWTVTSGQSDINSYKLRKDSSVNTQDKVVDIDFDEGFFVASQVGKARVGVSLGRISSNAVDIDVVTSEVVSIDLSAENASIAKSSMTPLTAIATLEDNTQFDITSSVDWHYDDHYLEVKDRKFAHGISPVASTGVRASFRGVTSNTLTMTVKDADIVGLQLSPLVKEVTLADNNQFFDVKAVYRDGSVLDYPLSGVTFVADKPSVAQWTSSGAISGQAVGSTELSVRLNEDASIQSNTATLIIDDWPLQDIVIRADKTQLPSGVVTDYTALGQYGASKSEIKKSIDITKNSNWQSNNVDVVAVAGGMIYANAKGQANIQVTKEGVTSQPVTVNVTEASLQSLQIGVNNVSATSGKIVFPIGTSLQAVAIATYSDGSARDVTHEVHWTSDAATLVSVDRFGVIHGHQEGDAVVTANIVENGTTHQSTQGISLTVDSQAKLETLSLQLGSSQLVTGMTTDLRVFANYSDASIVEVSSAAELNWRIEQKDGGMKTRIEKSALSSEPAMVYAGGEDQVKIIAEFKGQQVNTELTISNKELEEIVFSPNSLGIVKGETSKITAFGRYNDHSTADITDQITGWLVSGPIDVISLQDGEIKALAPGQVKLSAYHLDSVSGNRIDSGSALVVVQAPSLQQLELVIPDASMPAGTAQQVSLMATYEDGHRADVTSAAQWSADSDALSIVNRGELQAHRVAKEVTVSAVFDNLSISKTVEVTDEVLKSITINPTYREMASGTYDTFEAKGEYSDKSVKDITDKVTWLTSDSDIATFSSANPGELRVHKLGEVTLSASLNGVTTQDSHQAKVKVIDPTTDVEALHVTVGTKLLAVGSSTTIKVEAEYKSMTGRYDVTNASTLSYVSNTDILMVNGGKVMGINPGTATIEVYYKGEKAQVEDVVVTDKILTSLSIDPTDLNLAQGERAKLNLTAYYSDKSSGRVTDSIEWSIVSGEGVDVTKAGGEVKAVDANKTAVVQARYLGKTASVTVKTSEVVLTGIVMKDKATKTLLSSTNLPINVALEMEVYAQFSDGTEQQLDNDQVVYQTRVPSQTSISINNLLGEVKGLRLGTVDLFATYQVDASAKQWESNSTTIHVSGATVIGVEIRPNSLRSLLLPEGREYEFTAMVSFNDGTTRDATSAVNWRVTEESSDAATDVASIIAPGKIMTHKVGKVDLHAEYFGYSDSQALSVIRTKLETIRIEPSVDALEIGEEKTFKAYGTYDNNQEYDISDNDSLVWSVTKDSVATIDEDTGLLEAIATGESLVKATLDGKTGEAKVTVTQLSVKDLAISIEGETTSLAMIEGTSKPIKATVSYQNTAIDDKDATTEVVWQSTDTSVGRVIDGVFYALKANSTPVVLTATYRGVATSNNLVVAVNDAKLESLVITPTSSQVALGNTQVYALKGEYDNGDELDVVSEASWNVQPDTTNGKPGSARVVSNGLIQGTGVGEVMVTASLGSGADIKQVTAKITVNAPVIQSLEISPDTHSVAVGRHQAYELKGVHAYGEYDVKDQASWEVLPGGTGQVAHLGNGVFEAVKEGDVVIKATLGSTLSVTSDLTITGKEVDRLIISRRSLELSQGDTSQLSVKALYSNGDIEEVSAGVIWSVSSGDGVDVSSTGLVRADEANKVAQVQAQFGGKTDRISVTTTGVSITNILLKNKNTKKLEVSTILPVGMSNEWEVYAQRSDGNEQRIDHSEVEYKTDPETQSVIDLDSTNGETSGVSAGQLHLYAEYTAGGKTYVSNRVEINVSTATITGLRIEPNSSSALLFLKETKYQFKAVATLSDGNTKDVTSSTHWKTTEEHSDDPTTKVTVNQSGLIDTHENGHARLHAEYEGQTATQLISVVEPMLQSIRLDPAMVVLAIDETKNFQVFGKFDNDKEYDITNQSGLQWSLTSLSTAGVADIDETTGLLTAKATGSAKVKVTKGTIVGEANLTVTNLDIDSLEISVGDNSLSVGNTTPVTATVKFSGSAPDSVVTKDVVWRSSDTSIAVVIDGVLYALKADSDPIILTATYRDGTVTSNSVSITVNEPNLDSLEILSNSNAIAAGQTQYYRLTGHYDNGDDADVTNEASWTIQAGTGTASVVGKGEVQGTSPGQVTVVASYGSKQVTATLTINKKAVDKLVISPLSADVDIGLPTQFTLLAHYSDQSIEDVTYTASWEKVDSGSGDISVGDDLINKGQVIGSTVGGSRVKASLDSESIEADVNVVFEMLEIQASPKHPSFTLGTTDVEDTVYALALFTGGRTQMITDLVTWTLSETGIVSLTVDGQKADLKAIKEGDVEVTASINCPGAHCITSNVMGVEVKDLSRPNSIEIAPDVIEVNLNQVTDLSVRAMYSDRSQILDNSDINWQITEQVPVSGSGDVIEIDATGQLRGVAEGTAKVAAVHRDTGVTSSKVSATVSSAVVVDIKFNPSDLTIPKGTAQEVKVIAVYSNGQEVDVSSYENGLAVGMNSGGSNAFIYKDNEQGKVFVEATKVGNAQAAAFFTNGALAFGGLDIEVTDALLTSIKLYPSNGIKLTAGNQMVVSVMGEFTDGSTSNLVSGSDLMVAHVSGDTVVDTFLQGGVVVAGPDVGQGTYEVSIDKNTLNDETLVDTFEVTIASVFDPKDVPFCGTGPNDFSFNSSSACVKVLDTGSQYFTATPSIQLANALGLVSGTDYNGTHNDSFVRNRSYDRTAAQYYLTGDTSQGLGWCKKLKDDAFGGRDDWRVPSIEEYLSLWDGKGNDIGVPYVESLAVDAGFPQDVLYRTTNLALPSYLDESVYGNNTTSQKGIFISYTAEKKHGTYTTEGMYKIASMSSTFNSYMGCVSDNPIP